MNKIAAALSEKRQPFPDEDHNIGSILTMGSVLSAQLPLREMHQSRFFSSNGVFDKFAVFCDGFPDLVEFSNSDSGKFDAIGTAPVLRMFHRSSDGLASSCGTEQRQPHNVRTSAGRPPWSPQASTRRNQRFGGTIMRTAHDLLTEIGSRPRESLFAQALPFSLMLLSLADRGGGI